MLGASLFAISRYQQMRFYSYNGVTSSGMLGRVAAAPLSPRSRAATASASACARPSTTLTKVFTKLNVTSRIQLEGALT